RCTERGPPETQPAPAVRVEETEEREHGRGHEQESVVAGGECPSREKPRCSDRPPAGMRRPEQEGDRGRQDREEEHVRPHFVGAREERVVREQEKEREQGERGSEKTA